MREAAIETFGMREQWDVIRTALAANEDSWVQHAAVAAFAKYPKPTIDLIEICSTILQTNWLNEYVAYRTLLALVNRYEVQQTASELDDD